MNEKPNEHEIPAVTISYHSTKLGVLIFLKSACFVVTNENMLFCLISYSEHTGEAIKILFEWKQGLMVAFNFGLQMCSNVVGLLHAINLWLLFPPFL